MKSPAIFNVDLICLSLTSIFSELCIITGKNELQELIIWQRTTSIKIIELHHELAIFQCELCHIIFFQEVVKVDSVQLLVTICIKPTKGSIWLKIVQGCKFLSILFDVQLKVGNVPEELHEGLLRFYRKHFLMTVVYFLQFKWIRENLTPKHLINQVSARHIRLKPRLSIIRVKIRGQEWIERQMYLNSSSCKMSGRTNWLLGSKITHIKISINRRTFSIERSKRWNKPGKPQPT